MPLVEKLLKAGAVCSFSDNLLWGQYMMNCLLFEGCQTSIRCSCLLLELNLAQNWMMNQVLGGGQCLDLTNLLPFYFLILVTGERENGESILAILFLIRGYNNFNCYMSPIIRFLNTVSQSQFQQLI